MSWEFIPTRPPFCDKGSHRFLRYCVNLLTYPAVKLDVSAVNCGITRATKLLQASCAAPVDGVLGPDTLRRAIKLPYTCDLLYANRRQFYRGLSSFARFGNGWMARLNRLTTTAEQIRRDELRRAA